MNNAYILAAIFVSAAATFALRALPFVLMKYVRRYQRLFAFLSAVMPAGIMAILSLYCLASLHWGNLAQAAVSFAACSVLIILEHYRRQPVLSICVGLGIYVLGQSLLAIA